MASSWHYLDISLTYWGPLKNSISWSQLLNFWIYWQQSTFKSTDSWSSSHYIFFAWKCFRFIDRLFYRQIHLLHPIISITLSCMSSIPWLLPKISYRANLSVIFNQNLVVKTTAINWITGQNIGIWYQSWSKHLIHQSIL